ncbi:Fibronectin type III,Immunoglobulin subtype,Immunoglobulin-like domain,Immunoglobulin-like [Cinara cedri]|uniref:Fibronectin type III,Immunoglobulin subtype,Immunoglobulin-like domain,Immunoglobulin-like n=1 Tax=Cinara cedri TaxID=506608 RepID=A0A5E4NML3_9HEMI|nr:Fibronectin type III,Immunoglobulin subtype,Immunoglobulin-like domain,Immunoglobulin-like [Cinara cedri]
MAENSRSGNPQPSVVWLKNGKVVDEECEHALNDKIENKLRWPRISRQDLNSEFTCQASNTKLMDPRQASVMLDLRLAPLTAIISALEPILVADRRYDLLCTSSGSRPPARITWYRNDKKLPKMKPDDTKENSTTSEITFVPTTDDNGKSITCKAENPSMSQMAVETNFILKVVFAPIVSLRLGKSIDPNGIKEGDDVYFDCHVKANPPSTKLTWYHNGLTLNLNASARTMKSDNNLVLQKVSRNVAGRYACRASNSEGESFSNELGLRIKYAPGCKTDRVLVIGASRGESMEVLCEVDADPPAKSFRWKFNNSGETIDIAPERYNSNGTASVLRYTPVADLDYGTLSCWATNGVGEQSTPCLFQMVAAGKPQSVHNCTVRNNTEGAVDIQCEPGYDGGLSQIFVLEVYAENVDAQEDGEVLYRNLTDRTSPRFSLGKVASGVLYTARMYAANSKGKATPVTLPRFSFPSSENQMGFGVEVFKVSPMLITTVSVCLLLVLLAIIALIRLKSVHNRKRNSRQPPTGDKQVIVQQRSNGQVTTSILEADTDPDLIQVKYDPSDALDPRSNGGGAIQFTGGDPRNPCAGWIATAAGPSSSSCTGTLQRKTAAANERLQQPVANDGRRWDDVSPKPFSTSSPSGRSDRTQRGGHQGETHDVQQLHTGELRDSTDDANCEDMVFGRVNEFQYLGVMSSVKNDRSTEIGIELK